ncbi:MAG TPA: S1/P1 nuclease, partial [Longimicrobium sp.]|nr:S1/P1 nuclease [Longimicrobium sp.]
YPFNNLHAYWDGLVGFSVPWGAADRTEEDYVGSVARRITMSYPQRSFAGRLLPGAFEEWSREGMRIAQRVGYPVWLERGERAPLRYRSVAWDAAEPRVAIAGYRLADLLNRTLGT